MKLTKITDTQKEEIQPKALLVYDRVTGKIVHRHWYQEQENASIDKERILKLVDPVLQKSNLEVISIDPARMHRSKKYHINISTNLLEELP